MAQTRKRRKKKSGNGLLLALLGFLALAVIVLAVVLLLPAKEPAETEPTDSKPAVTEPTDTDPTQTDPTVTESLSGWIEQGGNRYYLKEDGTYATGWLDADGQRYYLGTDGIAYTGWQEVDGKEYYFKDTGAMAQGVVELEDKRYFFTATGEQILIVNKWNHIPDPYETDLKELTSDVALEDMWLQSWCYDSLVQMIKDCNQAMIDGNLGGDGKISMAYVVSAFRTAEHQERLYWQKVEKLKSMGRTQAEAEVEAATVNAIPTTSEHELGLAVDIIDNHNWSLVEGQGDLPVHQWLHQNSWRYGWILRYPDNKLDITGIVYEPWHYRYVGVEVAEAVYNSGLTLEEYIASLSE